jgi:3-phenylpropionate/trans-cinnamate dioxygenase ferredoxin reductase component
MHYRYLLIGGGIAADSAARGIRQVDQQGPIGLISKEPDPPYNRPPLSKGLWGRMPLKRIWRNTADLGVNLLLNETAISLDPSIQRVITNKGTEYTYDRLLLATGGEPVQITSPSNRILYFRTLQDYQRLRSLSDEGQRFLVIGGGFIGSELAAVLKLQGKDVTIIFPEAGIGGRVFPAEQSQFLTNYFREKDVHVLNNQLVDRLQDEGEQVRVNTSQNDTLFFDAVVAGIGIRPNLDLALQSGLAARSGILVDAYLRSENEGVFVAGDVMEFYQPVLKKHMRVEHEEHANMSGLFAGRGMAGELEPYTRLPYFYSDMFDLSYQAVGELNVNDTVVMDWIVPHRQGVIYYLFEGRLRGIALWDKPYQQLEIARKLIDQQETFSPQDLVGLI